MRCAFCFFALTLLFASAARGQSAVQETTLFRAGEGGYDTYRIPALLTTKSGAVLAFCEGRKDGQGDAGNIDLLLRRSTDHGVTWGPAQVLVDDGDKTCGNPCPILDRNSGDIVLLITINNAADAEFKVQKGTAPPRLPSVLRSTDDAATWSAPRDIGDSARKPGYRWYATGPGHGIQLNSGRMIAPCDHSTGPAHDEQFSHVLYSDDAGHTWAHGGTLPGKTNECIAVELAPGALYLNARNYFGDRQRAFAISADEGLTFGPLQHNPALIDPVCQASALLLAPGQVLFSNPASAKRENMTVRLSTDSAKTWPHALTLWPGPAAYSDLTLLANGEIACFYERGEKSPYETLTFARFKPETLTHSK